MKEKTKTKKELLAEIADLRRRLEVSEESSRKASNDRIGREHAEEALKKAENGQKKAENGQKKAENGQKKAENGQKKAEDGQKEAEDSLKQSRLQVTNLTSQLLLAEENERKRIAHELHDGLGQSLTAIAFSVKRTLEKVGDKVETGLESLEAIIPIIQESIDEVRKIGMNLRPSILDDLGLLSTFKWFIREYQGTYPSIHIEQQIEIEETQVFDHHKAVIYRILQEAMNNIAKHSKANLVRISLRRTKGGRVELVIEDNGIGFDMQTIKRGLGLGSMRERAEFSGGSFDIESVKGKGVKILASWPIEQPCP